MNEDPWTRIPEPQKTSESRLQRAAEGLAAHKFWRGKDSYGQYFFQFSGDFNINARTLPKSSNVVVSQSKSSKGHSNLVFTLVDAELRSLFRHLVVDMIESAEKLGAIDDFAIASVVLKRFIRWQELLGRARRETLSPNEVLGLFGELYFLKEKMFELTDAPAGIDAWRGPLGDEQDFALNGNLLEIKSQFMTKDSKVQISSAEQLDDISGPIYICHQTFSATEEMAPGGLSLNQIVEAVRAHVASDAMARDALDARLIESKYSAREEYDQPLFLENSRRFYRVSDGFPRITASQLASGIDKVSYRVSLEECVLFLLDERDFDQEYFGD
jgi:hypothetical protein